MENQHFLASVIFSLRGIASTRRITEPKKSPTLIMPSVASLPELDTTVSLTLPS